ncbi:MAG TPA: hypothetical protein VM425_07210 [Myxococcota bacterium]|nr:hypothetical protein [Myxococcota bacterium]
MNSRAAASLFFLSWILTAMPAAALVGDSDGSFGLDGSLRTVTAATVNYDYPLFFGADNRADGLSQTILRLTAGGRPAEWLSYEVHGVQDLSLSSFSGQMLPGFGMPGAGGGAVRYRAVDLSWEWAGQDDVRAQMWLDRCNLKFRLPFADVTIGRQAITFGKAYFYNPLDIFLAFDPRSFDRDYKAGVDALRIAVPLGDFSGLDLIGVAGREVGLFGSYPTDDLADADWRGSALLARLFTTAWEWDMALQGGKVYGGYQLGGAVSGELGPLAVRAEAAYLFAAGGDELTAVLGAGHRFENTLDIEAEYLYNGAGDPDDMVTSFMRVGAGDSYHAGRHIMGVVATYEILPILTGSLAWIFSFSDFSSLIQPGLSLSVSDEADFMFGAMIALGARPKGDSVLNMDLRSEFGSYPNFYYMEFKFYF